MSAACLFCRIVAGDIPTSRVHEDDRVIAIRDIDPKAPTHVLVLPRAHVESVAWIGPEDEALVGHLVGVAAAVARREGIEDAGFRLVVNAGADGGQTVPHLHVHLLGGRRMTWPPG
jgi:histidine triad (HIT) family protein